MELNITKQLISQINSETSDLKFSYLLLRDLSHSLRRKIISLLMKKSFNVTELYLSLKIEQSVASQHLAALRKVNILSYKREGKFISYTINICNLKKIEAYVDSLSNFLSYVNTEKLKEANIELGPSYNTEEKLKTSLKLLNVVVHPLRSKMLKHLDAVGSSTVNDLSLNIKIDQSMTSQHLSMLRKFECVKIEKKGKQRIYSVNYDILNKLLSATHNLRSQW